MSDEDLYSLFAETNIYMLASHLYWALWALIQVRMLSDFFPFIPTMSFSFVLTPTFRQAKMSPIDFDYLGYFFLRYQEYEKQKDACFALVQSYSKGSWTG